jgi:hypothetical protein
VRCGSCTALRGDHVGRPGWPRRAKSRVRRGRCPALPKGAIWNPWTSSPTSKGPLSQAIKPMERMSQSMANRNRCRRGQGEQADIVFWAGNRYWGQRGGVSVGRGRNFLRRGSSRCSRSNGNSQEEKSRRLLKCIAMKLGKRPMLNLSFCEADDGGNKTVPLPDSGKPFAILLPKWCWL